MLVGYLSVDGCWAPEKTMLLMCRTGSSMVKHLDFELGGGDHDCLSPLQLKGSMLCLSP